MLHKESLIYLKNYFILFFLSYSIIIVTKFIFLFYLGDYFAELGFKEAFGAIFWGYKFDFAMSAIIALLGFFVMISKKLFTFIATLLLVSLFLMQIGDILYFYDASRHVGYEVSDMFNDAQSLFVTALSQHTIITLLALFFSAGLSIALFKLFMRLDSVKLTKLYPLKFLLIVAISVFFIRGMTQHIPLNTWQVNQIGNSKKAALALNATYNVIFSLASEGNKLHRQKLPKVSAEISKKSLEYLYNKTQPREDLPLIKSKPNIVFLFLESWSAVNMKPYGFAHDTTPYYNKLLQESLHPKLMIAGGHRTTEGVFTTLVSFQNPLGKSVAKSQLQEYKYNSIIKILNRLGYSSAFFQGTSKETSGTGSFVQGLGFKQSYGKSDVTKRQYLENSWGIQDPDLYAFVNSKLGESLQEPFVIGINGATTHDDILPKSLQEIAFVKDKRKNRQLNALHFADNAMGTFIAEVQKRYPNTLFVVLADHCGAGIAKSMQNYMIPLAFYSKNLITPQSMDSIVSQRDIAPTLYDLAIGNYKKEKQSFSGKSLLQDSRFFADFYYNGIIGWIEGNQSIELNSATEKKGCYKIVGFQKVAQKCTQEHERLQEHALSFFNLSQTLLFNAKTTSFKEYRNDY